MIIELVLRKMLQEPPIFDGENPFFSCRFPLIHHSNDLEDCFMGYVIVYDGDIWGYWLNYHSLLGDLYNHSGLSGDIGYGLTILIYWLNHLPMI